MNKRIGDVELGSAPVIAAVMRRLSIDAAARAKAEGADMIELRLDLLDAEERRLEEILEFLTGQAMEELNMPVIITNRRREEGGSFCGTEDERIELLRDILVTGVVDAVDIEFLADGKREIIEEARKLRIPVILSFHDFHGMPAPAEILELIDAMYQADADADAGGGDSGDSGITIPKVAVTPRTPSESLNLLQLTHQVASSGRLLITIGMGDWGRHLRVIAPLYGSVLTYGFISTEVEVAPGQFSVHELRQMLAKLKPPQQ